jgi:hypothetical protein
MAQIGSFVLLLALPLSVYSFLAGLVALSRSDHGSERLGETSRRAGRARRDFRIHPRRSRHFTPHRSKPVRIDGAFAASQHAPLRRLHRPFRRAVMIIGILGAPFNREAEKEMGFGDKMTLGPTHWFVSLTLRNTTTTTAASGPSSMSSRVTSRSPRCIPSGASIRPAGRRRRSLGFVPLRPKTFTWSTRA